jgi:hypothetical protein
MQPFENLLKPLATLLGLGAPLPSQMQMPGQAGALLARPLVLGLEADASMGPGGP